MCKITVIENNSIGFIFGLDNMRSHRCTIDLARNSIILDSHTTVPFLSDGDINKLKHEIEDECDPDEKIVPKEDK